MQSLPEMIFETGDKGKGSLIKLLEKEGFPSPSFRPKKDTMKKGLLAKAAIPLQAADLLAYECFHPVREMEQVGHLISIRPSYEDISRILGDPKVILVKNMEHLQKFGTMNKDKLWFPDGPEDIPGPGL